MLRKLAVILLVLLTGMLAAATVLGMATGTHRQFDRGTANGRVIAAQLGLGAVFLVAGVLGLRLLAELWRGEEAAGWSVARWSVAAACLWVVWAFLRIDQYSS